MPEILPFFCSSVIPLNQKATITPAVRSAWNTGLALKTNTQPPLHELWLAARKGGYHFRWVGDRWVDSREGGEFFAVLSREISEQAGRTLSISA